MKFDFKGSPHFAAITILANVCTILQNLSAGVSSKNKKSNKNLYAGQRPHGKMHGRKAPGRSNRSRRHFGRFCFSVKTWHERFAATEEHATSE
jgi:hypothetical protein